LPKAPPGIPVPPNSNGLPKAPPGIPSLKTGIQPPSIPQMQNSGNINITKPLGNVPGIPPKLGSGLNVPPKPGQNQGLIPGKPAETQSN